MVYANEKHAVRISELAISAHYLSNPISFKKLDIEAEEH